MNTKPLSGCARCAAVGQTCCQSRGILVTEGDKVRIAASVGHNSFWEVALPTDPAYLDQDDDPNWLRWAFLPDGSRPILKQQPNGDCIFLTERGCSLPMETRPLVCRLHPYTYTETGITGTADDCPREVIPIGQTLTQALEMHMADATRWHRALYAELRTKEPYDVDRVDLRPAC